MKDDSKMHKTLPIRLDIEMYNSLNTLSFLFSKSMAEIIRGCLQKEIDCHKKVLTNTDITV